MGKHYPATLERRHDLPETRGRKPIAEPLVFKTVGLTQKQWDWLSLWLPNSSSTSQLRILFERCLKFWPSGPAFFR